MTEPAAEPVRFMQQVISLDYRVVRPPVSRDFGQALVEGRIVGHRCSTCGLVYVPPKGYCPLCVVATSAADAVEVADRGAVTSWTVLTPIQYHGQEEHEDYALASILLDGASGTVGQQRLVDVPLSDIRLGLRVEAVWADPDQRKDDVDARGLGLGSSILGWRPTGEPDEDLAVLEEHTV
jgi:hypothetical protein